MKIKDGLPLSIKPGDILYIKGESTKLEDVARTHFINTLRYNNWNRTYSANALGVSLKTVKNKIAKYRAEGFEIPDNTERFGRKR